jgi:hypothetical protein
MHEIIDLCQELECTFSYACEWYYTDTPVLKHEWSVGSARRGESNTVLCAGLDSCLQTALDWLKQIKAQRTV